MIEADQEQTSTPLLPTTSSSALPNMETQLLNIRSTGLKGPAVAITKATCVETQVTSSVIALLDQSVTRTQSTRRLLCRRGVVTSRRGSDTGVLSCQENSEG
jgi:hypothetical protein